MSVAIVTAVDIGQAVKGLAAMAAKSRALAPVFQSLKPALREDQKQHRKAKVGPDGGWAPRSAATIAANQHRKHARNLLGRLPSAIAYKADARSVSATSRASFAEIHMEGGTAGHGARIPARPFLWLSDRIIDYAAEVLGRAVAGAFGPTRSFGGR